MNTGKEVRESNGREKKREETIWQATGPTIFRK